MEEKTAYEEIRTENLILRPSRLERDGEDFLKMLREDGDVGIFTGIKNSEELLKNAPYYFQIRYTKSRRNFSIFRREEPEALIGYVGLHIKKEWMRKIETKIELEFYISKVWRNRGYCTEASRKILERMMKGEIGERYQMFFARTLSANQPCIRVLKKLKFEKINERAAAYISEYVDWEDSDSCQQLVSEYRFNCDERGVKYKKENGEILEYPIKILFADFWFKNKEKLRAYFKQHNQKEYAETYRTLLEKLIQIMINPELKRPLDIERIEEIDHGKNQGEKIWIIPYKTYPPDIREYIWTHIEYGSCSECDTLKRIYDNKDDEYKLEQRIEDYMTLSLHLLQRMRPLLSLEEDNMEIRFDNALYAGEGENMIKQLELLASSSDAVGFPD